MPSYTVLADLGSDDGDNQEEEQWDTVATRRSRNKPQPAAPAQTKARPAAAAPAGPVSRTSPDDTRPAPIHHQQYPRGPPIPSPRLNTHDDTGKPVTEDYYRAFQKCYKDALTGNVILKFHKTNVVTITRDGDVQLFTNNYFTYTTLCSINDALQFIDMKLTVKGDVKDPDNWQVNIVGNPSQSFSDNMIIKHRSAADRTRGAEVLEGMKVLLETTDLSAEHMKKQPRAPLRMFSGQVASAGHPPNAPRDGHSSGLPEPAAPAQPPPTIVPINPTAAPPPLAKGSAWAASGSLASRLAAESQPKPGTAEFPPLGPTPSPPATSAAAAVAEGRAPAPAPPPRASQPGFAVAPAGPAAPPPSGQATAASKRQNANAPYYASAVVVAENGDFSDAPVPAAVPVPLPAPAAVVPPRSAAVAPPPRPTIDAPSPALTSQLPDSLDEVFVPIAHANGVPTASFHAAAPPLCPAPVPYDNNVNSFFSSSSFMSGPAPASKLSALSALYSQQTAEWATGTAGDDDESKCVVCMHHMSNTILIPCGHTILCRGCADHVVNQLTPGSTGECPVCRTPVDLVLDVQ